MNEEVKLNDISNDLFILNQHTIDRLFSCENPGDCVALYCFYYKTEKRKEDKSVWATDDYIKKSLKWGDKRLKRAKEELKKILQNNK